MWSGMILCVAISQLIPVAACCAGQESEHSELLQGTAHSTHAPHGLTRLFDSAVTAGAGLTQVYQQNVHGGLSTSRRTGRYAGSYDVEASADLERALGLTDSTMYLLLEGGWPSIGGIDPPAVGSYFGVNADAIEGEWIDVAELWYLRSFADDGLFLQAGKVDLTAGIEYRNVVSAFDLNHYANDETSQFLNGALVNNPTIPFPACSLALSAVTTPGEHWQFAAAGATQSSDADVDEIASWASTDEGLFVIAQASFLPTDPAIGGRGQSEYHAGLWWTGGGELSSDEEQTGAYISASRELFTEADNPEDGRSLGLFARYGWTDGEPAGLKSFWSIGLECIGPFESRRTDVLGLGYANGRFTDGDESEGFQGSEQVVELYYRVDLMQHISISPDVQYVAGPGGRAGAEGALAVALRARILLE